MNTSVSDRDRHQLFQPVRTRIFLWVPLRIALPVVAISLLPAVQELARGYLGTGFVIAIVVGSILLALGFAWVIVTIARHTTPLGIEGDRLVYRSWGRTPSWPLADITKLVQGDGLIEVLKRPGYANPNLMFIHQSGRCFLRLGHQWAQTRIAHAIGVATQPIDEMGITAG